MHSACASQPASQKRNATAESHTSLATRRRRRLREQQCYALCSIRCILYMYSFVCNIFPPVTFAISRRSCHNTKTYDLTKVIVSHLCVLWHYYYYCDCLGSCTAQTVDGWLCRWLRRWCRMRTEIYVFSKCGLKLSMLAVHAKQRKFQANRNRMKHCTQKPTGS